MASGQRAHVRFNNINVNVLQTTSGIFVGSNTQWGWSSHRKDVDGFGDIMGSHNICVGNVNVIYDNDVIDTPIDDRDIMTNRTLST